MKPDAMHRLAHQGSHAACSPAPWHAVPKVTGDYDLDATILHRKNRDMAARLGQHLRATSCAAYGVRTASTAYNGNHGDD